MLKIIDKNEDCELIKKEEGNQIIITPEEINYLKLGKVEYINKNRKSKEENIKIKRQYNKPYLILSKDKIKLDFVLEGEKKDFYVEEDIDKQKKDSIKAIFTRKEIEEFFNSNMYEGMYVLDNNMNIIYASNKKDGKIITRNIIPSDEKIKRLEKRRREKNTNNKEKIEEKKIEEIENFEIFDTKKRPFKYLLIRANKGKLEVCWFRLIFKRKNKFELTISEVPVKEVSFEQVAEYYQNIEKDNVIAMDLEPNLRETIKEIKNNIKQKIKRMR